MPAKWMREHDDLTDEDYIKMIEVLLEKGYAYKCFCTPEELEAEKEACENEGDNEIPVTVSEGDDKIEE